MTLTLKKIQEANVRRCENNWHPIDDWSPTDWACAMGGEAGEALNAVKKLRRMETGIFNPKNPTSIDDAIVKIGDELADTIHYITLLAARLNIDLDGHIRDTFNKVSKLTNVEDRL